MLTRVFCLIFISLLFLFGCADLLWLRHHPMKGNNQYEKGEPEYIGECGQLNVGNHRVSLSFLFLCESATILWWCKTRRFDAKLDAWGNLFLVHNEREMKIKNTFRTTNVQFDVTLNKPNLLYILPIGCKL